MFLPIIKPAFRIALRILSILLFILTIFSAYGGRFSPQYFALPGVAVMALPFLGLASILVTAAWFISGRWITGAIGVAALIASSGPLSSAMPLKFPRNPKPDTTSVSVMSWNFLHGQDQMAAPGTQDGNQALDFIINSGIDIVCLQEMRWWHPDEVPNLNSDFNIKLLKAYPYMAFQPQIDNRVFSKYPVTNIPGVRFVQSHLSPDDPDYKFVPTRYSFYELNIRGQKLLIVNTHLKSPGLSDKERTVMTGIRSVNDAKKNSSELKNTILSKIQQSLKGHIKELSVLCKLLDNYTGAVIVCGDFNDVPESYGWRIMVRNGFKDAYAQVGFGPLITYNRHAMWLHLDQMLYRGPLRPLEFHKYGIKTSDHYPISCNFEFTN